MQESIDTLLLMLIRQHRDALGKVSTAAKSWDAKKAFYWQGWADAMRFAGENVQPLSSITSSDWSQEQPGLIIAPSENSIIRELENFTPGASPATPDLAGYSLQVPRQPLIDALRRMTRFRKKKGRGEMMVLSFKDGMLSFSMSNVTEGVPAEGVWCGDVIANSLILYRLAKVPPLEETVTICVEDAKLHIGSSVGPVQIR